MTQKRLKPLLASAEFLTAVLLLVLECEAARRQVLQSPRDPQSAPGNLTQVSIENLMNMEVTSVSKKEQKLSRTAVAVFVITPEDVRRSGATNIPDLLRMVPGMDMTQINGSTRAISARGFNAQFSNKLLVMIAGRIVYTPNFAGVYWTRWTFPSETSRESK